MMIWLLGTTGDTIMDEFTRGYEAAMKALRERHRLATTEAAILCHKLGRRRLPRCSTAPEGV